MENIIELLFFFFLNISSVQNIRNVNGTFSEV